MLKEIVKNTEKYTKTHHKDERKCKGQFFTPQSIVDFMADKAAREARHLSILEPGGCIWILKWREKHYKHSHPNQIY